MASPKYAWVIGMGCFLTGMTTMGGIVVFTYVMIAVASEFGIQVADLAICTSMYTLGCNGLSWAAGLINEKVGPRWTMGIGILGNSTSFILVAALAHSLGVLVALYAIAGAFASALVGSCMPKLISDWFAPQHRGKANMLYTMGPTLSGALMGIVIPILLASEGGWRSCFYIIGGFCFCCGLIFLIIVRNTPAEMGTHAFGYTEEEAAMLVEALKVEKEKNSSTGAIVKKVLSNKVTWCFGAAYTLWMCYFASMNTFGTTSLMEVGYSPTLVGAINSITMLVTVGSQLFFSVMSDYFLSRKVWLASAQLLQSAMMIGLYFILKNAMAGHFMANGPFIAFMLVMGFFGGQGAIMNTQNVEVFPPSLRATGPAVVATITMIGSTGGPLIAAAIVRAVGFSGAYILLAAPSQIVAAFILLLLVPATGGKHGDPQAVKEAQAALGEDAVAAAATK